MSDNEKLDPEAITGSGFVAPKHVEASMAPDAENSEERTGLPAPKWEPKIAPPPSPPAEGTQTPADDSG